MSKKKKEPVLFGGVASALALFFTHPLDLLKVRLQTDKGFKKGTIETAYLIVKNEGLIALYNGLSASILRQLTYSTVRFAVYDSIKEYVGGEKNMPLYQKFLAGMLSGALGGFAGNPADVINVRMQSDGKLPIEQRRNYKHAIDGLVRMVREEGAISLARGVGPSVNRAMLMTASQLATYDQIKYSILRTGVLKDGPIVHFSSSLIAGLFATTVCSPLDVIKTRMMNSKQYRGTFDCFTSTLKQEGPMAFFKGWVASFARLGPQTIISFMFLEQLKALYIRLNP